MIQKLGRLLLFKRLWQVGENYNKMSFKDIKYCRVAALATLQFGYSFDDNKNELTTGTENSRIFK